MLSFLEHPKTSLDHEALHTTRDHYEDASSLTARPTTSQSLDYALRREARKHSHTSAYAKSLDITPPINYNIWRDDRHFYAGVNKLSPRRTNTQSRLGEDHLRQFFEANRKNLFRNQSYYRMALRRADSGCSAVKSFACKKIIHEWRNKSISRIVDGDEVFYCVTIVGETTDDDVSGGKERQNPLLQKITYASTHLRCTLFLLFDITCIMPLSRNGNEPQVYKYFILGTKSFTSFAMFLSTFAFLLLATVDGSLFAKECPKIVTQKPFDISQVSLTQRSRNAYTLDSGECL